MRRGSNVNDMIWRYFDIDISPPRLVDSEWREILSITLSHKARYSRHSRSCECIYRAQPVYASFSIGQTMSSR